LCQPMLSLTVVTAGAALEQHTLAKLVMQFGGCGGVLNISPGRRRQPELINEGFLGFAIRQPTKNGAVNKAGVLGEGISGDRFGPLFTLGSDYVIGLQV